MNQEQREFLNRYLATLPELTRRKGLSVSAEHFCADEESANVCAELVLSGQKTATCSLKWAYEHEKEPYPILGHLRIVTDWSGKPVAITETVEVDVVPFSLISEEFARAEGEGDGTLEWWKAAHWQFFSEQCAEMDLHPTPNMPLFLERFKVVYT